MATNMIALKLPDFAIPHFEKSLEVAKIAFGLLSEKTLNAKVNLGAAYLKVKNFPLAISTLEQAISEKESLPSLNK